jgi:hypothetical protein
MRNGKEVHDGTQHWYLNDELHRTDGPAIEYANGAQHWYLNGYSYHFDKWLQRNGKLSEEEKLMFKLQYG